MTFRPLFAWALGLFLACSGCASNNGGQPSVVELLRPFSASTYMISPTDTLRIDVYREKDLSGKYYVDPSGTINLPLLGRVPVAGETAETIERKLAFRLSRGFLVDPDVRVSVAKFRPIYISGEVKRPGEYPFTPGMSVQQAMVMAGGQTRFAAEKYFLQRNNAPSEDRIRVEGNSLLYPGDVISVGERLF